MYYPSCICGPLFAVVGLPDFVLHKSFTSSECDGVTAMEIGVGTGDGLL